MAGQTGTTSNYEPMPTAKQVEAGSFLQTAPRCVRNHILLMVLLPMDTYEWSMWKNEVMEDSN